MQRVNRRRLSRLCRRARRNLQSDRERLSALLGTAQAAALITAVGALAAAYSANEARKVTSISADAARSAREMPVRQERYNQRLTGLREYTEAEGDYMTQLLEMADAMPDAVNYPASISDASLAEASDAARQATEQYRRYTTRVNKARSGFSGTVQEQVEVAGAFANTVSMCFRVLGSRHVGETSSETLAAKRKALEDCRGFYAKREQFDDASQAAIATMISELNAAWSEPLEGVTR